MANVNPYQRTMAATETARDLELRVLRTVNHSLKKAKTDDDKVALTRAVTNNYLIWQTFLFDVISDENKLPRDLRRSIAIVARSVMKEIDSDTPDKIDIDFLVSINDNIIEGLAASTPR